MEHPKNCICHDYFSGKEYSCCSCANAEFREIAWFDDFEPCMDCVEYSNYEEKSESRR